MQTSHMCSTTANSSRISKYLILHCERNWGDRTLSIEPEGLQAEAFDRQFPHASMSKNKRILYVGGLAEEVNEKLLHAAFIPFGDLAEVTMPLDTTTRGCLSHMPL